MKLDKQAIEEKFKNIKFTDLNSLVHHILSSIHNAHFCREKIIQNPAYEDACETSRTHGAILKEHNTMRQQVEKISRFLSSHHLQDNTRLKRRP